MMHLWREPVWENHPMKPDDVVFKRGLCAWVLPLHVAVKVMKYNERHLPVVQRSPDNEAYYIRLSIRRLLDGYRASKVVSLPPSPFKEQP